MIGFPKEKYVSWPRQNHWFNSSLMPFTKISVFRKGMPLSLQVACSLLAGLWLWVACPPTHPGVLTTLEVGREAHPVSNSTDTNEWSGTQVLWSYGYYLDCHRLAISSSLSEQIDDSEHRLGPSRNRGLCICSGRTIYDGTQPAFSSLGSDSDTWKHPRSGANCRR